MQWVTDIAIVYRLRLSGSTPLERFPVFLLLLLWTAVWANYRMLMTTPRQAEAATRSKSLRPMRFWNLFKTCGTTTITTQVLSSIQRDHRTELIESFVPV